MCFFACVCVCVCVCVHNEYGPDPATVLSAVHKHEKNPKFNEHFQWNYDMSTSKLFISVWDKDEFNRDDLIGEYTNT